MDILTLTVTEFRAMRKALAVLCRAGVDRATAIQILTEAHEKRRRWDLSRAS